MSAQPPPLTQPHTPPQVLLIKADKNHAWWLGQNEDGVKGWFLSTYVVVQGDVGSRKVSVSSKPRLDWKATLLFVERRKGLGPSQFAFVCTAEAPVTHFLTPARRTSPLRTQPALTTIHPVVTRFLIRHDPPH